MQQDRGQQQIARASLGRRAIDRKRDRRAIARNQTVKQAGVVSGIDHRGIFAHNMCS